MKVSFKTAKDPCKEMVKRYRRRTKDSRKFPDFFIHSRAQDGRKGEIHIYEKAGSDQPKSKEQVSYNSIPELTILLENIGNAWERTNPKYRSNQRKVAKMKPTS